MLSAEGVCPVVSWATMPVIDPLWGEFVGARRRPYDRDADLEGWSGA